MITNKRLESVKLSILLFFLVFILNIVVYMTKNMFSAAMAMIVEEGVMSKSQTGTISALFWLVYAIFQVIGGFAADRFSPLKLVAAGLISGIVSNAVIYANHSYGVILTVWCINAAFQFGIWPACFKIVSSKLNKDMCGPAVFWILMTTSIGQTLSMLVASYVSRWYENFIVSAVMLSVMLIIWLVAYPLFERKMTVSETDRVQITPVDNTSRFKVTQLAGLSGLYVIMLVVVIQNTLCNGLKTLTPVMLMESYNTLPAAIATRMSIILIVFAVIGMFISNVIRAKVTSNEMRGATLLIGLSIPATALTCFTGRLHYITILIALSASIMFIQGASPFVNSFVSARFTKYGKVGAVSGILNACAAVGNVISSYVFPKMAEYIPWNRVAISWVVLITVSVLLIVLITPKWTAFIKANQRTLSVAAKEPYADKSDC